MTYAIIEASGTQLRVEAGRFYDINRLSVEEDETVTLDRVLFVSHDGESTVGQPLVEGATVSATVMRHLRGRKVIVYKMQPKKKTRKKRGHRQELTRLMIDAITMNDEVLAGQVRDTSEDKVSDNEETAILYSPERSTESQEPKPTTEEQSVGVLDEPESSENVVADAQPAEIPSNQEQSLAETAVLSPEAQQEEPSAAEVEETETEPEAVTETPVEGETAEAESEETASDEANEISVDRTAAIEEE